MKERGNEENSKATGNDRSHDGKANGPKQGEESKVSQLLTLVVGSSLCGLTGSFLAHSYPIVNLFLQGLAWLLAILSVICLLSKWFKGRLATGLGVGVSLVALLFAICVIEPNFRSSLRRSVKWRPPELQSWRTNVSVYFANLKKEVSVSEFDQAHGMRIEGAWGHGIWLHLHDNRFFVDADINLGNGVLKLRAGKAQLPEGFDWNSNSNQMEIVEIVNDDYYPVYHVRYIIQGPDSIGIVPLAGSFIVRDNNIRQTISGHKYLSTTNGLDYPPGEAGLQPTFKYPSWEFPGQFADSSE